MVTMVTAVLSIARTYPEISFKKNKTEHIQLKLHFWAPFDELFQQKLAIDRYIDRNSVVPLCAWVIYKPKPEVS